jgi:hypothetical protein
MNYKDLQKRLETLSCLMADIEDPSLLMESMELNEEDVKTYLSNECHNFLYNEFKDTEAQLERLDQVFKEMDKEVEIERAMNETWTMVKDSENNEL